MKITILILYHILFPSDDEKTDDQILEKDYASLKQATRLSEKTRDISMWNKDINDYVPMRHVSTKPVKVKKDVIEYNLSFENDNQAYIAIDPKYTKLLLSSPSKGSLIGTKAQHGTKKHHEYHDIGDLKEHQHESYDEDVVMDVD